MFRESKQTRDNAERLVVIDLLGQARGRSRTTLYRHLRHHDHAIVSAAIDSLIEAGVLTGNGERVVATPALACLEQLGLIAV
ncbi:MAG TPA: hypothetical protein VN892_14685 [Solirubrobacteraceae bacterium]|nr:hypothetical protein [Solirubrobacteraceae bacterium]